MRGKKTITEKIAILAATLFIGVFINSDYAWAKHQAFSPFVRVATVDAVFNAGDVDALASYEKGIEVGKAIANYIGNTDESDPDFGLGFPSNWVVAGDEENIEDRILNVPSKQKVPNLVGPKKIQVIEICNKAYAKKALGAAPILADDPDSAIPNGLIHATALPCEISVHFEDDKIHVYMLNAEAIFTLFFTDVVTSDLMLDPEFREQMQELTAAVKSEMHEMIYAALDANTITFDATDDMAGPVYRNIGDAVSTLAHTVNQSPYVHSVYRKQNGEDFSPPELATIAATVTETLTYEGQEGSKVGVHPGIDLSTYGDKSSSWRAARAVPLGMPDGSKVVEPCSPTYAKEAIGTTRLDHAPALPCEIAFRLINGGTELLVSYLDPNFMFGVMFSDMSDEEIEAFGDIPAVVLADLQKIVNYSFANDLPYIYENGTGIDLDDGEQVYYDMLLGDGFHGVANKRR